jgi:hypothetical protein
MRGNPATRPRYTVRSVLPGGCSFGAGCVVDGVAGPSFSAGRAPGACERGAVAGPLRPGQPIQAQHCEKCQPRQQIAAVECALCDDSGLLLIGDLADEMIEFDSPPAPVLAWLTARGWRSEPGHGLICPDHPPTIRQDPCVEAGQR